MKKTNIKKKILKYVSTMSRNETKEQIKALEDLKDNGKYYEAIRLLCGCKRRQPLIMNDENGRRIADFAEAAELIACHFKKLF